jgi:uncharacterized membrane protein YedE/YeeE
MNNIIEFISQPWPWYVSGPLIGFMIPALLIIGNKSFGISSNLRHICASCFPGNVEFFRYSWRDEIWNLYFAGGILIGGFIAMQLLSAQQNLNLNPEFVSDLNSYGLNNTGGFLPEEIFSWSSLVTPGNMILIMLGGFLVGFGARYAGGCTSGHSIMGLSTLQWPSLVATCCFMAGGIIASNFIVPLILKL